MRNTFAVAEDISGVAVTSYGPSRAIVVGDFNRDGKADLAVSNSDSPRGRRRRDHYKKVEVVELIGLEPTTS